MIQYSIDRKEARKVHVPQMNHSIDIVIFWKQNDTGLYGRRVDMVIKYLASREDVRKVVVFDKPISRVALNSLHQFGPLMHGEQIYAKTHKKLSSLMDTDKVSYKVFVHTATSKNLFNVYSQYIADGLKAEGIEASDSCFWFYPENHLAGAILDYFNPKKVVVDIVDDHRAWPNVPELRVKALTEQYQSILARADIAIANCQPVIDSMRAFRSDIHLIPNGCEDNPEIIEPVNHHLYEELKAFKGKVIGFVGNLEAKIDIVLIEKVSKAFPEALIILVGSTHANAKVRELQKHANIRMFGVVPYENINAVVRLFDVGIVPHLKMDLTKNMNPLKVFVYLANSVPVVATDVENVDETSSLIYRATNHDDFIFGLKKSLNTKKDINAAEFNRFVSNNAWSKRFEKLAL